VLGVLARGMRDNPMHIAAFGADADRRERVLARVFGLLFRLTPTQVPLVAVMDGTIVGVTGVAPPGTCQQRSIKQLLGVPILLSLGPVTLMRFARWVRAWAKRDLHDAHWHLGPFAVDRELQGHGIGTQILAEHCRRLDEVGGVGYLETDKDVNVRLYQRSGYEVIGEADVIGVHCWYMRRPPIARS